MFLCILLLLHFTSYLLHFTYLLQVSIFNFPVYHEFWVTHWNITNRSNKLFVCFSLIFNRNSYYFSVNSGFYTALLKKWQLNDQKEPPEVFYKKSCSYKFRNIYRKTPAMELQFIKKRLLHRRFPVTIAEF